MQKLPKKKVLLIGNDEGPKSISVQNLFDKPEKPLTTGVSLDANYLQTTTTQYEFWCVDSHELDNDRVPIHYFQHCSHVIIIPKDHNDLINLTEYISRFIPEKIFSVMIPSFDIIMPLQNYSDLPLTFVLTAIAQKMQIVPTLAQRVAFIENIFNNETLSSINKTAITEFRKTSFFNKESLPQELKASLLNQYIFPALICLKA